MSYPLKAVLDYAELCIFEELDEQKIFESNHDECYNYETEKHITKLLEAIDNIRKLLTT